MKTGPHSQSGFPFNARIEGLIHDESGNPADHRIIDVNAANEKTRASQENRPPAASRPSFAARISLPVIENSTHVFVWTNRTVRSMINPWTGIFTWLDTEPLGDTVNMHSNNGASVEIRFPNTHKPKGKAT